jgi:deoxycytidylate deaminase
MAETDNSILGYFPEAELVLALVYPLGTERTGLEDILKRHLAKFGYETNPIRLTRVFPDLFKLLGKNWGAPTGAAELARYKIEAGNQIRRLTRCKDILARVAAGLIHNCRAEEVKKGKKKGDQPEEWRRPLPRTAHIIFSLKRPEEVDTLRRIYGNGFFLLGLSSSKEHRDEYFTRKGIAESEQPALIDQDAAEVENYGQQTRKTFHLADVFFTTENFQTEVPRFLDLVFGCPTITPTLEEQAMFMAYAASLRSGDLSRQVGAAIIDDTGDLISVGYNDVPKFGGGLYGPEGGSERDIERKYDSNAIEKNKMIAAILQELGRNDLTVDQARSILKPTGLTDITEFGRSVHAEMEALLACARTARSARNATLYSTTFPCHNCCRHIIAAGIRRVVYVEPYPKSKAPTLHGDAISVDQVSEHMVPFLPFIGIGPRRYFDLFSLKLSTGYPIERKEGGKLKSWQRLDAPPRLQMQPTTYLDRESLAWESLNALLWGTREL